MQTGDEPHYYITLYSLINDEDIFLTNNYNNAFYKALPDLGTKQTTPTNRHTRLFDSQKRTIQNIPFVNKTDINLSVIPPEDSYIKEVPGHPIGLPLFAYFFLWPLKNTPQLEHFAILLTTSFTLVGLFFFYKLLLIYHKNEKTALVFTTTLALATPYWHYSKTFWSEPYLASIMIISWYFLVLQKRQFIPGLLLGFSFLMKYTTLLIIIPLTIYTYIQNRKKLLNIIFFTLPLLISAFFSLGLNYAFTTHPLQFNQAVGVQFMNPLSALVRWFFSPTFGLFTFSPILILSILGIQNYRKTVPLSFLIIASSSTAYVLFWSSYIVSQFGGGGYSARYLIPIIPFFVLIMSFMSLTKNNKKLFYLLFLISVIINFLAAFAHPAFTGYSLFESINKIFNFLYK